MELLGEASLARSLSLSLSLPSLQVKLPAAENAAKPSHSGTFSLPHSGLVFIQMWVRGEEA